MEVSLNEIIAVDLTDGTLFGNDAGEDELPEVLNSYFVDQPAFRNFISKKHSFQIARSRKGMGKSALLSKLAYDLEQESNKPLIVKITGANLLAIATPPAGASFLELQNFWARVICARINYALGNQLGFAFSETAMALVESAEIAGFRERNLIGSLIQRIKSSQIPIEVKLSDYGNHEELLKRALLTHKNRDVWLLVDDIDSTYVDSSEQYALTSTFFSACRAIVREVKGLFIRASVRSDVWSSLRKNEDLDKCEQYVTDISWTPGDLKVILSKKVYSYFQRNSIPLPNMAELDYRRDADKLLEYTFTRKMQWGRSSVPPFRPVYILSAGRPRWMSQLCRFAGVQAAKEKSSLIRKVDINSVLETYSRFRLNDIYKEHAHQYENLQKLIETFSNCPSRYSTNDIMMQLTTTYVNLVGANNISNLDGYPYRYPMQLAHFLYKIGFIVGRRDHRGESGNADFVRYEQRPELLSDTRNPDDGLLWEIHPSYRDALNIGKENKAAPEAQARRDNGPSRKKRRHRITYHRAGATKPGPKVK